YQSLFTNREMSSALNRLNPLNPLNPLIPSGGSQFAELNAQNSCAKVCLLLGVKSPCRGRGRGRGRERFRNLTSDFRLNPPEPAEPAESADLIWGVSVRRTKRTKQLRESLPPSRSKKPVSRTSTRTRTIPKLNFGF